MVGTLIALGGVGVGVVYWYRGTISARVSLGQTDTALQLERERTAAMEYAAAAARGRAALEFDAKVDTVSSAADAAALLREASGSPKDN
jgi:hypothetical protein